MAQTKELSRLLGMREPATVISFPEAVKDPTDYSHQIKHRAYSPSSRIWAKSGYFETPEVDFNALRRASRTEPFFRRRANRYQNLCWKNGYVLETENDEAKDYILSRMELFSVLTGESFDSFLRKVSRELIMFDNCIILERRVKVKDLQDIGVTLPVKGIGPLKKFGPVVAYEILPVDTIRFKRDEYGNVQQWQQIAPTGESKDFSPKEVILIKNDEEAGDVLAFPVLQMVLPDARILRQLETDASLAAHRLAFPIFKYMVGNTAVPETLPKKDADLDGIWYTLEGMLLEGALIIPGSDDFEVVLSDVKMDGLSSVMQYFKNRVIVGLGLSPVHMGESDAANRSVTDRLDVQLYDDVKAFQKTLQETITIQIFSKWLLEGGFSLALGANGQSENKVALMFREIDTDSLIKRENHTLQKWVQDLIDHDEARQEIGRTPMGDTTKLYSDLIGGITAKYAEQVGKATAQATAGGAGQGSNAKTKVKKTSSSEPETINNFRELNSIFKEEVSIDQAERHVDNVWQHLYSEVSGFIQEMYPNDADDFDASDLMYVQALYTDDFDTALRPSLILSINDGIDRGFNEARAIDPDVAPMKITTFNRHVNTILKSMRRYMGKLMTDLFERVEIEVQDSEIPWLGVEVAFAALHYRLDSITSTHLVLAENWGVAMVAKHAGYDKVWQESEAACKVCKTGWVDVNKITLNDVPPFSTHPHCTCKMHIRNTE